MEGEIDKIKGKLLNRGLCLTSKGVFHLVSSFCLVCGGPRTLAESKSSNEFSDVVARSCPSIKLWLNYQQSSR